MKLEELRKEIDRIDQELVRLLNERARCAVNIGEEKKKGQAPVHDPAREDEVLERIRSLNSGPLDGSAIDGIYRAIIAECARIQKEEQKIRQDQQD